MSYEKAREIILNPSNYQNREINAAVFVIITDERTTQEEWWIAQSLIHDYDPGYFTPVF